MAISEFGKVIRSALIKTQFEDEVRRTVGWHSDDLWMKQ